jgi:cytochrome P450
MSPDADAGPASGGAAAPVEASCAQARAIPPFDPKKGTGLLSWLRPAVLWWGIRLLVPCLLALKLSQWLLRIIRPIVRVPGWALIYRYDDVAEVLSRNDVFTVPFDSEIARLNDGGKPGTPFILGIDNPQEHDPQARQVMQAFRRSDVDQVVVPLCRCEAEQIVKQCAGQLDAIPDLITAVPLKVCQDYYGVHIAGDRQKFAEAAMAVSVHLFGPPPLKADPRKRADPGAAYVRWAVDGAIERESGTPSRKNTVLARLVTMESAGTLTRLQVRAFLMGMIIGFVPTNTIAGGHILQMLLRKPQFMAKAREAALAGDDDLLKHCLFEAMRFKPLDPGPYRTASRDFTVAAGTPRATSIPKGVTVWPLTESAMFDPRKVDAPSTFNPSRPASDNLVFGYGIHWCVGAYIAQAQITQTFKALLRQPNLRRAPGVRSWCQLHAGTPAHLFVRF